MTATPTKTPAAEAQLPRGIRNNNPGNIERTHPRTPWQGVVPLAEAAARDDRFEVFKSPVGGIRALVRTLITYQDKHKLATVAQLINRWAPPAENVTHAYVAKVVRHLRAAGVPLVDDGDRIDVHDYATARALAEAIVRHENGPPPAGRPRAWYSDEIYDEALRRAGVISKTAPPARREPAVQAAGAAAVGGAITIAEAAGFASTTLERGSLVATLLGVALVGIAVYALVKSHRRRKLEHEL